MGVTLTSAVTGRGCHACARARRARHARRAHDRPPLPSPHHASAIERASAAAVVARACVRMGGREKVMMRAMRGDDVRVRAHDARRTRGASRAG